MQPITSSTALGQVLRQYRKTQGLTQSAVAKKFNMTQTMISNIESGRPGVQLATLFKVMAALGLEMHLQPRGETAHHKALW